MPRSEARVGLLALLLVFGTGQAASMDAATFARKLERAQELNTSAPWRESQAILDELRPHLNLVSPDQQADFVYLEARNLTLAGQLDEALLLLQERLRQDMSPERRVALLRLAANAAILARHFEQTFTLLGEALALLERRDLPKDEGVYSLASYVYTRVGELQRGRDYGELALRIARESGDLRGQCSAGARLAYVHKMVGNFGPGSHFYRQAIEHCLEAGDELIAGVAEAGLADLLRMRGDHGEAVTLFEQGIDRLTRVGYRSGLAEARLYLARLEQARGNFEEVQRLLDESLEQFAADDNSEYLAEAHEMLAAIQRARGNLDAALDHYDAYMKAREDHLDLKRARQLAFLEVEFDLKHTEQQLALLREQARVSDLELQARRQQARLTMAGYGLGSGLLFVLALLLIQATRDRRRYQNLSRIDGLTSVNNHTRFFALASQALTHCAQDDQPFTLILGDIDHFKQVNDHYGHHSGDEVLRRVGARLRECFGRDGIIGRIGGEEFAVALPRHSIEEADRSIERFREKLGFFRVGDAEIATTMSFGVAERVSREESLTRIRERADEALYNAKRQGRNRVIRAVVGA